MSYDISFKMIFDGNLFDDFRTRYEIRDVEKRMEEFYDIGFSEPEIRLKMSGIGFEKMMQDFSEKARADSEYCKITFEVDKLDTSDKPLIAKYDNRYDLATVRYFHEKLQSEFPDRKIIALPKDINIEAMGVDGLTVLRDQLTDIINNLNYDNIIGF